MSTNGGPSCLTRKRRRDSRSKTQKLDNLSFKLKEETRDYSNNQTGELTRDAHFNGELRVEQRRALDTVKHCKIAMQLTVTVPTTPNLNMNNLQFTHSFARVMGLPPPMYAPFVGTALPNKDGALLDAYGWNLSAARYMRGGDWDERHDSILQFLAEEGRKAGLRVNTEIYNLFAASCPQLAKPPRGGEYGTAKARQAMIPDAQILQGNGNTKSTGLAELKIINCCPARYPGTNGDTAVAARGKLIQGEYEAKAKDVEKHFEGAAGLSDQLLSTLRSYGPIKQWVFGAYGEANAGIHDYIDDMAKTKAAKVAQDEDDNPMNMRSKVVSQLRRATGIFVARANANVGINRLQYIGPGGARATERREEKLRQRRAEEAERRANYEAAFRLVHPARVGWA